MNQLLLYNGRWIDEETPLVTANNRGFRYGDGLFETIKVINGNIHLAQYHFERLFAGLQLLQFDTTSLSTPGFLSEQILALCNKNKHSNARVRLTVFRGNGGLYDSENHLPNYIVQSSALNPINVKAGLSIDIYPHAKKSIDAFANCKTNNYLAYSMAAIYAKQHRQDDMLILNTTGRICDASIANVFMVKKNAIYTPPLSEGCVAGVMRRHLLESLPAKGFNIEERIITVEDIEQADELFLTNAIQGIRSVKQCGKTMYGDELTKIIVSAFS